jgi:hypothetical protein
MYIVGTSHSLQCGSATCTPADIRAFYDEIRSLCAKFNIQRIAEEMTADGLAHHKVNETVAERVTRDIGIHHQSVDLSEHERRNLSLDDSVVIATVQRWRIFNGSTFRESFDDLADAIRERVWIARLLSGTKWPVLFICGSNHSISVRRICRALGMDVKVVHLDLSPNSTPHRTRARASRLTNRRAARAGERGRYTATKSG